MKTLLHDFLPASYLTPWAYDHDSSIKTKRYHSERLKPLVEPLLRAYIASQAELQKLDTKSGNLWSGGLNEPKFMVNGDAFDGDWGRPQRWALQCHGPDVVTVLMSTTGMVQRYEL